MTRPAAVRVKANARHAKRTRLAGRATGIRLMGMHAPGDRVCGIGADLAVGPDQIHGWREKFLVAGMRRKSSVLKGGGCRPDS